MATIPRVPSIFLVTVAARLGATASAVSNDLTSLFQTRLNVHRGPGRGAAEGASSGRAATPLSSFHASPGSGEAADNTAAFGRGGRLQGAGLGREDSTLGGQLAADEPKVFFLFMARDRLFHPKLWQAFFDGAPPARARRLLHCTDHGACSEALNRSNPLGLRLVSTVPSTYCKDLVSPMVQLLRSAVAESSSAGDKFAFLSESTLPMKPFQEMYEMLTMDRESDFCIAPRYDWKISKVGSLDLGAIVKHFQWIILNRNHADTMVERWPRVTRENSTWSLPLWPESRDGWNGQGDSVSHPHNVGLCADEWVIFATVYGVMHTGFKYLEELPGFAKPIELWSPRTFSYQQGVCRTFATWLRGRRTPDEERVFEAVRDSLSCHERRHFLPDLHKPKSNLPTCGYHAAEFVSMTEAGLEALRRSPYLFARKFLPDSVTKEMFLRAILAPALRTEP